MSPHLTADIAVLLVSLGCFRSFGGGDLRFMGRVMTVLAQLRSRIASGELNEDDAQLDAAARLDDLLTRLEKPSGKPWFFSRRAVTPKGLYLWGGVGRGKSSQRSRTALL